VATIALASLSLAGTALADASDLSAAAAASPVKSNAGANPNTNTNSNTNTNTTGRTNSIANANTNTHSARILTALARTLSLNSSLRRVDLSHCALDRAAMRTLAAALIDQHSLAEVAYIAFSSSAMIWPLRGTSNEQNFNDEATLGVSGCFSFLQKPR
jgi:hypothetical protein